MYADKFVDVSSIMQLRVLSNLMVSLFYSVRERCIFLCKRQIRAFFLLVFIHENPVRIYSFYLTKNALKKIVDAFFLFCLQVMAEGVWQIAFVVFLAYAMLPLQIWEAVLFGKANIINTKSF